MRAVFEITRTRAGVLHFVAALEEGSEQERREWSYGPLLRMLPPHRFEICRASCARWMDLPAGSRSV